MAVHYKAGQYMGNVLEQGFSESNAGNPQIVIKLRPYVYFDYAGGVESEDNLPPDAYPRTIYLTVTEKTTEFVLKKLRAAGFQGDSFRELDLVGKSVRCRCSHGVGNNGEDREEWDLVYQAESKPLEPLDSSATRKLDALFGRMLKEGAKPQESPSVSPPTESVAVGAEDDDDVPF